MRRRRPIDVLLFLVAALAVAPGALADGLAAAEAAFTAAERTEQEAARAADARATERDRAQAALVEAGRAVTRAREGLRYVAERAAALSLMDGAREAIVAEDAAIEALRKERDALDEDDPKRESLDWAIDARRETLASEAERFEELFAEHRHDTAEAEARIDEAEEELAKRRAAYAEAGAAVASARRTLSEARDGLADARAALAAESEKAAPPWVTGLTVRQGGETVYAARWTDEPGAAELVDDRVDELRAEVGFLEDRLAALDAESDGYVKRIEAASTAIGELWEEFRSNEWGLDVAVPVARWSAIVGLAGAVLGLGQALVAAVRAGAIEAGGSVIGVVARETAKQSVFKHVARVRAARTAGMRAFLPGGGAVVTEMIELELAALAESHLWTATGTATFTVQQTRSALQAIYGPAYSRTDLANLAALLEQADTAIGAFPDAHADLEAQAAARQAMDKVLNRELLDWVLDEQAGVVGLDRNLLRRWLVGSLIKPDAVINLQYDRLYIVQRRAEREIAVGLLLLSIAEWNEVADLLDERRALLDDLLAQQAAARFRTLERPTDEPLVTDGSLRSELTVELSVAVPAAPVVRLGPSIEVTMSGSGRTWTGTFDASELRALVDEGGGIQVTIEATDAAGHALDADPESVPALVRPTVWTNWEASRDAAGEGRGGPDTWHVLGARDLPWISWVLVVDASGSMGEDGRLASVKQAVAAFTRDIAEEDEVAVWTFAACDEVRLALPFTTDREALTRTVGAIRPGKGTPLAAAIRAGGDYLLRRARYRTKRIVVLSDGGETCQGDPQAASAELRERIRVDMTRDGRVEEGRR